MPSKGGATQHGGVQTIPWEQHKGVFPLNIMDFLPSGVEELGELACATYRLNPTLTDVVHVVEVENVEVLQGLWLVEIFEWRVMIGLNFLLWFLDTFSFSLISV